MCMCWWMFARRVNMKTRWQLVIFVLCVCYLTTFAKLITVIKFNARLQIISYYC